MNTIRGFRTVFFLLLATLSLSFLWPLLAEGESTESPLSIGEMTTSAPPHSLQAGESPEAPYSVGWDVTLASKYLFQGIDYSEGNPVAQPELVLSYKDFWFTSWFNYDLEKGRFDEIDLYLQYKWNLSGLTLAPGYAYYNYPHREGWKPSQEVYLDISYETFLSPSLSSHYDFDKGDGAYFTFSLAHQVESSIGTFALKWNLFYQENYYELTGFPSTQFSAAYTYSVKSFSVTPSISYFLNWANGDFRDENAVPDTWLFALNVAQTF
jgi:uncharacterized protein (TIGR02001 family)